MTKKTLGYIVVGGDGQPLQWYEGLGRFHRCLYSMSVRWATHVWNDYNQVRRLIRRHNTSLQNDVNARIPGPVDHYKNFRALRIVRLIEP